MYVMTYSQARQNLSSFLDRVKADGSAIITRADGTKFKVTPVDDKETSESPLLELYNFGRTIDEPFQKLSIAEIIDMLHEAQDERADRIINAASGKSSASFYNSFNK